MSQGTPKISSRPGRSAFIPQSSKLAPQTPSSTRSPPLTTSQNSINVPLLTPKQSSVKIKIKSATTPEAKSRLLIKPLGGRTGTANKVESPVPPVPVLPSGLHRGRGVGNYEKAMTPSESEGSLGEWIGRSGGEVEYEGEAGEQVSEGEGQTETVMVTVRSVHHLQVELRTRDKAKKRNDQGPTTQYTRDAEQQ